MDGPTAQPRPAVIRSDHTPPRPKVTPTSILAARRTSPVRPSSVLLTPANMTSADGSARLDRTNTMSPAVNKKPFIMRRMARDAMPPSVALPLNQHAISATRNETQEEATADTVASVTAATTQSRGLRPSQLLAPGPAKASAAVEPACGERAAQAMAPPAIATTAVRRSGSPLESTVRREFEQRFGHDFAAVRIHCDGETTRAATALGARAYTLGHHIAIKEGLYNPFTAEGHRLLAHELTHVVQQAAFGDHQLAGANVLGADHPSERNARAGHGAATPLAAPAVQCDSADFYPPLGELDAARAAYYLFELNSQLFDVQANEFHTVHPDDYHRLTAAEAKAMHSREILETNLFALAGYYRQHPGEILHLMKEVVAPLLSQRLQGTQLGTDLTVHRTGSSDIEIRAPILREASEIGQGAGSYAPSIGMVPSTDDVRIIAYDRFNGQMSWGPTRSEEEAIEPSLIQMIDLILLPKLLADLAAFSLLATSRILPTALKLTSRRLVQPLLTSLAFGIRDAAPTALRQVASRTGIELVEMRAPAIIAQPSIPQSIIQTTEAEAVQSTNLATEALNPVRVISAQTRVPALSRPTLLAAHAGDARFAAANAAIAHATREGAPTISAASLGTIGTTESKAYFRRLALRQITSEPCQPPGGRTARGPVPEVNCAGYRCTGVAGRILCTWRLGTATAPGDWGHLVPRLPREGSGYRPPT